MNTSFAKQLGRNKETYYIDDMIVERKTNADYVADLKETFETLRQHHMKLISKKCTFGVRVGKFLVYMIDQRGTETNSDKVKTIHIMKPPSSMKGVQKLSGYITALHRFMSQSAEKCLPLFDLLKKKSKFDWTKEVSWP